MVSYMGSLVCDWLLSAGDKKLAEKFRKEAKPEPLPPNSPGWLTSSSTTRRPLPRRGRLSLLSMFVCPVCFHELCLPLRVVQCEFGHNVGKTQNPRLNNNNNFIIVLLTDL